MSEWISPATVERVMNEAVVAIAPDLQERLVNEPDAYLDLVRVVNACDDRTRIMLDQAVQAARSAGHSWEAIGSTLAISRQAAQQRFGGPEAPEGIGQQRVLRRVTAFNEQAVLSRAGRYGYRLVGYGPRYIVLERDSVPWQHVRRTVFGLDREQMDSEGWRPVGAGWGPWVYYARPMEGTALPDEVSDEALLYG